MSMPNALKTPTRHSISLAALLALATLTGQAGAAAASGTSLVENFYGTLLSAMQNGRTLGRSGRFAQLEPLIRRTFDTPAMARLTVGPIWATSSETQRQRMIESFGRYIVAIYADRFDSYAGQRFEVEGERPTAAGVMVRSRIIKATGEPVNVDYLLGRRGEIWLISDVYLDGAISEVATRRSEFAAILQRDGIDGLIAALDRKIEGLMRTSISELPIPGGAMKH